MDLHENTEMTLNSYQTAAARTSGSSSLAVLALGLAGEAGEVADQVKKILGHGHPSNVEKILDELGDVLWYVSQLAGHFNRTLDEVGALNIAKLKKRYPNGFSADLSLHRDDPAK